MKETSLAIAPRNLSNYESVQGNSLCFAISVCVDAGNGYLRSDLLRLVVVVAVVVLGGLDKRRARKSPI